MVDEVINPADQWTRTDENLAMLIDRIDYWLATEYTQWVTDPNDPDVKRRQAERKRSGEKSPPIPIIFPVASRPKTLHEERQKQAEHLREYFTKPAFKKQGESSISALDRALG